MRAVNVININNLYSTILYKYITMPKGRTGIIPGKKNFTAVGGVGAKRTPIRNLINAQALPPTSNISSIGTSTLNLTPPPPPTIPADVIAAIQTAKFYPTPLPSTILFDLDSITKQNFRFHGDGNPYLPSAIGPFETIPDKYINGIVRAVKRWSKFIAFYDDTVAMVCQIFKTTSWNGLRLVNFKLSYEKDGTFIMRCTPIVYKNTCFNYGYKLEINTFYTTEKWGTLSESQLFHIFTHELGHALGMPMFIPNLKNGTDEAVLEQNYDPGIGTDIYKIIIPETSTYAFPNAVNAYVHYGGAVYTPPPDFPDIFEPQLYEVLSNNYKILPLIIPLECKNGNHWNSNTIERKMPENIRTKIKYRGVYNDLMVPLWNPNIDNTSQYLITRITIGELTDIFTSWNGNKFYNYYELTPGASEVTGSSIGMGDTIVFEGVINDSKQIRNPENKNVKEIQNPNSTSCISHNCKCKPIFITDLSELEYCL